ncbi:MULTISPECIES: 50S ribosomal protein L17 [Dysgonomonas]|uniref:50S ribosomal protein L17 n=1 Tax=Dysgonomonas TaxID=156973 RepID=UPI00092B22C8|nr:MULTISPECIES: 50S ribosomal protein L17 [Dysgonomonas]MBN9302345.1 50S ribosomal protein L17 [Dysgonomonas mossii]OJX63667.1 MAG: 50S ribosomal protein L17 [Dysgonomonas sp. 37-18]
MRHNKKINHLGRKSAHRNAMLSNMCTSLLLSPNKRIFTTVAKAKALRKVVEPIITKSKEDTTQSRRLVFQELQSKAAVTELFQNISQKIADRPGGYTRIIKTGNRLGDNASMCFIELVDYNENMLKEKKAASKGRTRRSKKKEDDSPAVEAKETAKKAKAEKAEKVEKAEEVEALEVAPETLPVVEETAAPEAPVAEEPKKEEE